LFLLLGHAQTLAKAGHKAKTEKLMQKIFAQAQQSYLSYYQVALVYLYLGEKEKALDALERTLADNEGWLIWLGTEPALDGLRSEERFQKLLVKVNHPLAGA
jgi:adenylate cyclase